MLTISGRQYGEMERLHKRAFRIRIVAWLRKTIPGIKHTDEQLYALVERQQPRAAHFSLVSERDIAKWCFLAVVTGEQFDKHEAVVAFLRDPRSGPSASDRLDALMRDYAKAADAAASA
jgi:hypothetical protein